MLLFDLLSYAHMRERDITEQGSDVAHVTHLNHPQTPLSLCSSTLNHTPICY